MVTDKQYNNLLTLTPVFILDHKVILDRIKKLENILKLEYPNYKIAYSFKTNYCFANSKQIRNTNLFAEVVSNKEFNLAKNNNFKDENIIFNGPNKDLNRLPKMINNSVLVNIDNFTELIKITKLKNISRSIGLRVNVNIKNISKSRFGFNIENGEVFKAVELAHKNHITIETIHCHIGTNINSLYAYKVMTKKVANLINKLKTKYNINIMNIDLGGGFPSKALLPKSYKDQAKPIEEFIKTITHELKKVVNKNNLPRLIFEPGRYLVDDSVYFFTKVIDKKSNQNKQILTVNATMNMIPSVWYKPQKIKILNQNKHTNSKEIDTIIYGASCQENDIIFKGKLNECLINNTLVFYSMGAYNASLAADFIFDKPKEIVI